MTQIYCPGLDSNISTWGKCIMETAFFGDPLIMGIILYIMFGLAIYSFGLPGIFALPMGLLISYAMYMMNPSAIYFILLAIAAIANFAWLAFIIMKRFDLG